VFNYHIIIFAFKEITINPQIWKLHIKSRKGTIFFPKKVKIKNETNKDVIRNLYCPINYSLTIWLQSHHLLPSSVIQVQVFSPNFSFNILLLNSFHNFLFIYQQISLTQFTTVTQNSFPFQFPHSNFTPFSYFLHSQFPFKIHKLYTDFASGISPFVSKFIWVVLKFSYKP